MEPIKQKSKREQPLTVKPTSEKRVRLSCDIERRIHRKLRMAAAATDKTILQVVESLIEGHCNCE